MSGYFAHKYFTSAYFAGRYFPPLEDAEEAATIIRLPANGTPMGMLVPRGDLLPEQPERMFDDDIALTLILALTA